LTEQFLVKRVSKWPSEDLLRTVGGLVGMILWASNLFYGGIHLTAWNYYFPTVAERWLWRSSSIYISFCGGFWIILNYMVYRLPRLNNFWDSWMDGMKGWLQDAVLGSLVMICGLSFILARGYIVLEAFVSIRQLPRAAYDTPSWSQIWPHL
jgi:hypothetical protein